MSARKDLIESIESALNFNKEGAEKFFDKVVSAIKEELTPKDQTFQEFFGFDEKPQLIQGYTAEQWQEIIDGGYLCEFNDSGEFKGDWTAPLAVIVESGEYFYRQEIRYTHCRPARIKGVMRPIFVEPVDDDADVVFFDQNGFPIGDGSCISTEGVSYVWKAWHEKIKQRGATKYIEL